MDDMGEKWRRVQLLGVLEEMKLQISNGDWEMAHGEADDLLLQALDILATDTTRDVIAQLVDAFGNVGKWYA